MDDQRSAPDQGAKRRVPVGTLVAGGLILLLIVIGILAYMMQSGAISMTGTDMDMNDGALLRLSRHT